jgi:hypothetical protein
MISVSSLFHGYTVLHPYHIDNAAVRDGESVSEVAQGSDLGQ